MIFIDSWIWIEYFSEGKKFEETKNIFERIVKGEKCFISTIALVEVKYKIAKKFDMIKADKVTQVIEDFPNISIVPVTKQIAKLSANLRLKYYKSKDNEMSYADAIHLATAILTSSKTFYSGDNNFKSIEEIKTIIV